MKPAEAQRYPHANRWFLIQRISRTAPQPDDHAGTKRHGLCAHTAGNGTRRAQHCPRNSRGRSTTPGCPASAAGRQDRTQQPEPNDEAHRHFGSPATAEHSTTQRRTLPSAAARADAIGDRRRRTRRRARRAGRRWAGHQSTTSNPRTEDHHPPGRRQKMGCELRHPPRTVIRVLGGPEREDSDSRAECWCATCEYVTGR